MTSMERGTTGRSGLPSISLFILLIFASLSILWGNSVGRSVSGGAIGFQGVYYGTRCLLHHCDPYAESELIQFYKNEGKKLPESIQRQKSLTLYVNLPSTFVIVAPLALLPWGIALTIWMTLTTIGFIVGALLLWNTGAQYSPGVALLLSSILLLNCEVLFATGNTAGIVLSLCYIAVWCLLNDRYSFAGMICLAVCLVIKPHDTGLVWFYFLLAGGMPRKRALQSLAVSGSIVLLSIIWIRTVAPGWLDEFRANVASIAGPGGLNEPGINSMTGRTANTVISLESLVRALGISASLSSLASHIVCGVAVLAWIYLVVRLPRSNESAWWALACAAPLTILLTYHRPYDAKLLILSIPFSSLLWTKGGATRAWCLAISVFAIFATADIPLSIFQHLVNILDPPTRQDSGVIVHLMEQPVPIALLAMTLFYLFVGYRETGNASEKPMRVAANN